MTSQRQFYEVRLVEQQAADAHVWFSEHPALVGCHAVGRTQEEAVANLEKSRDAWLIVAKENGIDFPEPEETQRIVVVYLRKKKQLPKAHADSQAIPYEVEIGDAAYV